MWLVRVWMRLQPLLCSLVWFAGWVCLCGETNEGTLKHQQVPHSRHERPNPGRALRPRWNDPNRRKKWAQVSCLVQWNKQCVTTHTYIYKTWPDCLPVLCHVVGVFVRSLFQGSLALWVWVLHISPITALLSHSVNCNPLRLLQVQFCVNQYYCL